MAEAPAILRWMIDGCLDWQENGIIRPTAVTEATSAYFNAQDLLEVVQNGGREGRHGSSLITLFSHDNTRIVIVQTDVIMALLADLAKRVARPEST